MVARILACMLALAAPAAFAAPVPSPNGKLGVLPQGRYLCELPGDAAGPASRPVAGQWFDVINASSYVADGGAGTYLMTGDAIVFTRGPLQGARFQRVGPRTLHRTDLKGDLAMMRCVRSRRAPD